LPRLLRRIDQRDDGKRSILPVRREPHRRRVLRAARADDDDLLAF
jgi:hypothetical protein